MTSRQYLGNIDSRQDIYPFSHQFKAVGLLEVDHVRPNRSMGQLTNLQLLCCKCHKLKKNSPPGEKDSSPFKFEGEPCKHQLTCVKWANLCNGDN